MRTASFFSLLVLVSCLSGGGVETEATTTTDTTEPTTGATETTSTTSTTTTTSTASTTTTSTSTTSTSTTSLNPECGNGVPEPPTEMCDDGNQDNEDDCPDGPGAKCENAYCGDGFINSKGVLLEETCEGGMNAMGAAVKCREDPPANDCHYCGDGSHEMMYEACDKTDENDLNKAVCRDDCTFCGDGIIDPGEECDDGKDANGPGGPAPDMMTVTGAPCSSTCTKNYRYVFVSSKLYTGDLQGDSDADGLSGANRECQMLADSQGSLVQDAMKRRSFRAWLNGPAVNQTFVKSSVPYVLASLDADADIIAADFDALIMAGTERPWRTETGSSLPMDPPPAWTNTAQDGTLPNNIPKEEPSASDCSGWKSESASEEGVIGYPDSTGKKWTLSHQVPQNSPVSCDSKLHIYCFEQ